MFTADTMITTAIVVGVIAVLAWLTVRYIPNDRIGIVEKLWSLRGSLKEGAVIALNGEAGYQADILRGGLHFGLWRWQYAVHKFPLITIKQGKIGYVFCRGGDQLMPSQTLAKVVECNNFQDAQEVSRQRRAKRPPARHPPRRRVRDQHRAVQRDYRGPRVHAGVGEEPGRVATPAQGIAGFQPADHQRQDRSNRHRDRPRRPDLAARRADRPRRGHRQGPAELPQQLPGYRGLPGRRRPPRRCNTCR